MQGLESFISEEMSSEQRLENNSGRSCMTEGGGISSSGASVSSSGAEMAMLVAWDSLERETVPWQRPALRGLGASQPGQQHGVAFLQIR